MYQLMIVDDEVISKLGISHMVNWEEYGYELAASASNGKEALEIMKKIHIDLVITDVKMPIVDGVTLMKLAKEENIPALFILMSAYDDFAYVREGLVQGALDYILKLELRTETIIPLLQRVTTLLQAQDKSYQEETRNQLSAHTLKEAQRSVLKNIMFGRFLHRQDLEEMCGNVNFDLKNNGMCMLSFSVKGELTQESGRILEFIEDILTDYPESYICETMLNEMSILYNPEIENRQEQIENLEDMKERLGLLMAQYFNMHIQIIASDWIETKENIPGCYLQIQHRSNGSIENAYEENNNYIVRKAKQYIEEHFMEGIKIKEIADSIGVSNSYLSSLFHQEAGLTLKEYSQQLQIQKAKNLLRESNEMISSIAYSIGYENEQQFSRVFKQKVGVSPSIYRNQI